MRMRKGADGDRVLDRNTRRKKKEETGRGARNDGRKTWDLAGKRPPVAVGEKKKKTREKKRKKERRDGAMARCICARVFARESSRAQRGCEERAGSPSQRERWSQREPREGRKGKRRGGSETASGRGASARACGRGGCRRCRRAVSATPLALLASAPIFPDGCLRLAESARGAESAGPRPSHFSERGGRGRVFSPSSSSSPRLFSSSSRALSACNVLALFSSAGHRRAPLPAAPSLRFSLSLPRSSPRPPPRPTARPFSSPPFAARGTRRVRLPPARSAPPARRKPPQSPGAPAPAPPLGALLPAGGVRALPRHVTLCATGAHASFETGGGEGCATQVTGSRKQPELCPGLSLIAARSVPLPSSGPAASPRDRVDPPADPPLLHPSFPSPPPPRARAARASRFGRALFRRGVWPRAANGSALLVFVRVPVLWLEARNHSRGSAGRDAVQAPRDLRRRGAARRERGRRGQGVPRQIARRERGGGGEGRAPPGRSRGGARAEGRAWRSARRGAVLCASILLFIRTIAAFPLVFAADGSARRRRSGSARSAEGEKWGRGGEERREEGARACFPFP